MLKPNENRIDYGEQLNAPDKYELDAAVATTYSLDLDALLAVSVALGFKDTLEGDLSEEKALLFETLTRLKDKLKVFYQQGKITLPANYNHLFTLLEPYLSPIIPEGGEFSSFHPKLWLLRFKESNKTKPKIKYRLIILTRNLTFDKSWDIAASLDGEVENIVQSKRKKDDWIDFFLSLFSKEEDSSIKEKFTAELPFVKWSISYGKEPKLLPGISKKQKPLDLPNIERMMVVSPFIKDAGDQIKALKWLGNKVVSTGEKYLFSRAEELNAVGEDALNGWECYAINDGVVDGEERIGEGIVSQNLHAKLIVTEQGTIADWHVGSANATSAALGDDENNPRNTEFMLRFNGESKKIGIDVLLSELIDEEEEKRGLFVPHKFEKLDNEEDKDRHDNLRKSIFKLIKARWLLKATKNSTNGNYTLDLIVESDDVLEMIDSTTIRIDVDHLSDRISKTPLSQNMRWEDVKLLEISAFISISIEETQTEVSEKILIKVDLEIDGDETREQMIFKEMFDSNDKILNYIRMLLNTDAGKNEWMSNTAIGEKTTNGDIDPLVVGNPMFEQLMLTASRHKDALKRINNVVEMLKDSKIDIPKEFNDLWVHFSKELENA